MPELGSGLIQGKDGNLYGTTPYGGSSLCGDGTVYNPFGKGVSKTAFKVIP